MGSIGAVSDRKTGVNGASSFQFFYESDVVKNTMEMVVRAVDIGFGQSKYVTACTAKEIRCASFPSVAYLSAWDLPTLPATEHRNTVAVSVNGLFYEVSPDVGRAAESLQATQLHGSGAFLFKKTVREAFPRHKIHEVKDPIYANVKRLQIAGLTMPPPWWTLCLI